MKTINSLRSKLLALTLALMASVSTFAYEFEYVNDFHIDGFGYKVLPSNTLFPYGSAALIEIADCNKDVVIPEFVSYGNTEYRIITFGMGSVVFTNDASSVVESITIPKTTNIINKNVLAGCPNLKTVVVDSENPYYDSRENCNAIITTSQNPYFTPNTLIAGCKTTIIPNSVAEIGDNAFYNCESLDIITIPNSVTKIGNSAFNACSSLSSIILSENLTAIGDWAFADCNNLSEVVCYALQPPTISKYTFPGFAPWVYVPTESIERYKAASEWKKLLICDISWFEACNEYKHVKLSVISYGNKLIYSLVTDDGSEIPDVDSVWILNTDKEPLQKFYGQSRDTIDLLFLELGTYILEVYLNECVKSKIFFVRHPKMKYIWCDKWNVMWFDGLFFDETASTSQYRLGKDTVIGNYTYSKFTSRTSVRFTNDRKVYVYYEGFDDNDPYSEDLPTGEYLAYDFSAQVGDTLEVFSGVTYNTKTYKCVVYDVQTDPETNLRTIMLHPLRVVDGNGNVEVSSEEITWIEGVGSPRGFLIGTTLPGGGLYALLCAYKGDELKYTGSLYDEYGCEYNATEQNPEDLFPTLTGLQRTEVKVHTTGADAPHIVSFDEYTHYVPYNKQRIYLTYDRLTFLREENNQVLLYAPSYGIKEDVVLYDWTLEVGDTLPYNKYTVLKEADFIVTDVSTITLLDGKEYKKWTLACGIEYIEGIGAINGGGYGNYFCLQYSESPAIYIENRLVCASRNGQLLYQMDNAEMERLGAECLCEVEKKWSDTWCDTWNVLDLKYRTIKYTTKEDFETWRYYLAQDTIINNYTYTAVTRQTTKVPEGVYPFTIPEPEYVAAVRFTDDRKVYIYYDNTEYLLYDFNVQPGDELTVFAGINHYHSHHTNTIRVDEVERYPGIYPFGTEISLSVFPDFSGDVRPTCFGVTKWVEGVGDLCGFITGADCGLSEYQTALLCAYKDGNTEYTTEYEEYAEYGCEYNSGENKEYILTLPGLQRTVCNEYCGETEDDNSDNITYKQTFDSIFFENDKPYILCNDYLLREEDNKIFLYSQSLNKDIVLYDFTLEVGDSLPAYIKDFDGTMYSDDTLVVTDISSVTLLDGKEYKKWTFDNGMEYVEGIGMYGGHRNGNFFGLIQEIVVPCHTGTHLVCVSKNNKLLYQMDPVKMDELGAECLCDYDRGPRKDNAKDGQIGGRPTPTQWNQLEVVLRQMDNNHTILQAETFSYTLEDISQQVNNKTYFQLARQSTKDTAITKSVVGALHFGKDEDNRVYFLRDGVEYVLYDFTAEIGDTVEIFAGINNYPQETTYTHVVVDKDTIEDGACRMFLEVVFPDETTAENAEKVWLAGLGSVDGIVHNAAKRTSNAHAAPSRSASSETESSVMLCAWREDSCLYTTNHPDYDTFGCVYNQDPTAVEDISTSQSSYQKLLRDGQLFIIHDGKTYNVLGVPVE